MYIIEEVFKMKRCEKIIFKSSFNLDNKEMKIFLCKKFSHLQAMGKAGNAGACDFCPIG